MFEFGYRNYRRFVKAIRYMFDLDKMPIDKYHHRLVYRQHHKLV
jgi:hypothetical protein